MHPLQRDRHAGRSANPRRRQLYRRRHGGVAGRVVQGAAARAIRLR